MEKILQLFTDSILLLELAISLAGLIFMCAFTYATRWLSPKALERENSVADIQVAAIALDPLDMELTHISKPVLPCKAENAADAAITAD